MSPSSADGGKDLSLKPGVTIHQEINQNGSEEVSRQINKHMGYLTTQCLEKLYSGRKDKISHALQGCPETFTIRSKLSLGNRFKSELNCLDMDLKMPSPMD